MGQMKLGIIAEWHDKASKHMRKYMRMQQKMEKSAKTQQKLAKGQAKGINKTARAQDKLARSSQKTGRALKSESRAAMALKRALNSASRSFSKLINQKNRWKKAGALFGRGGKRLGRAALVAGGLATAAAGGAAMAANTVIGPAAQMEQYQVILETTEGSVKKAKASMAWVTNFAVKTPYELNEVMESFVKLRAYGLNPMNGMLRTLGDTSAAMGKPIIQSVEAIADAVTGENERLKEFGIKASKTGKNITYEYTNALGKTMRKSVRAGKRLAIQQTLMKIWSDKYGGAMGKLSKTWKGMVSNMADQWFKFRLLIAKKGVFKWAKDKLKGFLDLLNKLEATGQLDRIASTISKNIITTLKAVWEFGKGVASVLQVVGQWMQWAAERLGGWNRLAAVLMALPLAGTLANIAIGIGLIAKGLSLLLASPIGLIIAGVAALAAAAWLIYKNWDGIAAWFARKWQEVKAAVMPIWNWLTGLFDWDAGGALRKAWAGLASIASSLIKTAVKAAEEAWAKVTGIFDKWDAGGALGKIWLGLKTVAKLHVAAAVKAGQLAWKGIESLFSGFDPKAAFTSAWSGLKSTTTNLINGVKTAASTAWDSLKQTFTRWKPSDLVRKAWGSLKTTAGNLAGTASAAASTAWAGAKRAGGAVTSGVTAAAGKAAGWMSKAWNAVKGPDTGWVKSADDAARAIAGLKDKWGSFSQALAQGLAPKVQRQMDGIRSYLSTVSFHQQGSNIMQTLADGMRSKADAAVAVMRQTAQRLRDHLPSSPAKVGPLSDLHKLRFGETIAASIRPAPMVKAMRAASLAAMTAATPLSAGYAVAAPVAVKPSPAALSASSSSGASGGASIHIEFKPTITIGAGANISKEEIRQVMREQADDLVRLIEKRQKENARLKF